MYSLGTRRWSPDGARPHVLAVPGPPVADLAALYLDQIHAWWQQTGNGPLDAVLAPVPADRLHLTLGWADRLTTTLPADAIGDLADELTTYLHQVGPVPVRLGPAIVAAVAIELHVMPSPQLDALAAISRRALRHIAGDDAAPEPPAGRPWRPHVSIAYAQAAVDTDEVAYTLRRAVTQDGALPRPVDWLLDEVIAVDQDMWPAGRELMVWTPGSVRPVRLGAGQPAGRPA